MILPLLFAFCFDTCAQGASLSILHRCNRAGALNACLHMAQVQCQRRELQGAHDHVQSVLCRQYPDPYVLNSRGNVLASLGRWKGEDPAHSFLPLLHLHTRVLDLISGAPEAHHFPFTGPGLGHVSMPVHAVYVIVLLVSKAMTLAQGVCRQ